LSGINYFSAGPELQEIALPDAPPGITLTNFDRVRVIMAQLNAAERAIGARHTGALSERIEFILSTATRTRAISPTAYQLFWFLHRLFKTNHVLSSNGTPVDG
jgi:hypothetical protein